MTDSLDVRRDALRADEDGEVALNRLVPKPRRGALPLRRGDFAPTIVAEGRAG
jgi:hypothetical protein